MERNTLLAIVLSFLVLFSYQAIFVAHKQAQLLKNSQTSAAQDVISNNASSLHAPTENNKETTTTVNKTADYDLKTTNADISYTNVGGSLHSIDFLEKKTFPITDILSINGFDNLENVQYKGRQIGDKAVSLMYAGKEWEVKKDFVFKDKNLVNIRMEIKNIYQIKEMKIYQKFPEIT